MRTYGRIPFQGGLQWVEVNSDQTGSDDYVWITTVIQNCKLILGESPFFANYGIPSEQAVMQQLFPDFYVTQIQQRYSQYFASLVISRVPDTVNPTYLVNIITKNGAQVQVSIAT